MHAMMFETVSGCWIDVLGSILCSMFVFVKIERSQLETDLKTGNTVVCRDFRLCISDVKMPTIAH